MSLKFFVTGTDTGIGKTYTSVGLLKAFNQLGFSTIGIKPIASGASYINNMLCNEDALDLMKASSIQLAYEHINPFVFEAPIAPHIAAERIGSSLSVKDIISKTRFALNYPADIHLIEGAGGPLVPLNQTETLLDFALHDNLKVILVVGIRLGCINHALLTYQAIKQANLTFGGWVANCLDKNCLESKEIITTLQQWLKVPYLGTVPYGEKPENHINIKTLLDDKLCLSF